MLYYYYMSFRVTLSIVTAVLLVGLVILAWPEIVRAWQLMERVHVWVLLLMLPMQLLAYYFVGGVIFSYLREKGDLAKVTRWSMTRIALELNFVNHILPSGGAAGFSYLGWTMGKMGVRQSRIAMSQIVRYALLFSVFVVGLFISLAVLTLDHGMNRLTLLLSGILTLASGGFLILAIYILGARARMNRFGAWLTKTVNGVVRRVSFGRIARILTQEKVCEFFDEIHDDYLELRRDRKILKMPLIWTVAVIAMEVALLWLGFLALGAWVNPATLLVAYGISTFVGIFAATPGGAGVYEAVMIAFLSASGVAPDIAIAGTLLARVVLLTSTIVFGYVFYQMRISGGGKPATQR